jgi:hypothetical protein
MRLTRTLDLSTVTAAQDPELRFDLRYDLEEGYDHVIVEARTAGGDDWTTLPDLNGGTTSDPPADCEQGFLLELHPFLGHYLGGADCTDPGTTGEWNSFTGTSDDYVEAAIDLSAYAGKQVEISITHVTDPVTGGVGAAVDDTRLVAGGVTLFADGFEGMSSGWVPSPAPQGSPVNAAAWRFGANVAGAIAGTATEDTLLLGFGLEQLATQADRAELLERALGGLLGAP